MVSTVSSRGMCRREPMHSSGYYLLYKKKNKLILHLKISGTVFYPGKYIFLFWCHNESKEISIQKIFIALWKNLITEWGNLHNIKLCSLLPGWILSFVQNEFLHYLLLQISVYSQNVVTGGRGIRVRDSGCFFHMDF